MWINVKINPPNIYDVVLVRMDDGTMEKECYAVAEYDPTIPGQDAFQPVNCHSSYDEYGTPALDFSVISWRRIEK